MNLTLEGVRKILNLSYKDLPCHLKTCLLFLGMYPEDYTILRSDLERQWMAESFVSKENGHDVEKVASNYFNDLVNRSLIQPVEFDKHGSVTKCKVHDMMLDLILLKCAQENFLTILDDPQTLTGLAYKIRRLSIRLDGERNGRTILPRNINMSQVRSVMFFGSSKDTPPLSEFKVLRVIFIDLGRAIVDLTGLCKLYQLKYLWIGKHCSHQLPIEIRVLEHLETLVLPSCDSLPSDIVRLPRLIHLDVETGLPDGVDNMKSLRHLCTFHLEKNSLDNIKGLGELTNLRYLILKCNGRLDNRGRRLDVLCSSLGNLCSLEDLLVYLPGCIDGLMPLFTSPTPYRLERLVLLPDGWVTRVPSWMGQLRHLCELKCEVGELLTDGAGVLAGLPVLGVLELQILNATRGMIVICGKAFPALKRFKLQLSSASYLTFQVGAMPKLQRLQLNFNARGSEQNGYAPAGIEHLLALEEFSAHIGCVGTQKSDLEAAFSSALAMHPTHPRVGIDFLGYYDFYGED